MIWHRPDFRQVLFDIWVAPSPNFRAEVTVTPRSLPQPNVGITEARARGGVGNPRGLREHAAGPGSAWGRALTSPGPGPGSTLTAPGGAALTSFFRRLWCLSALRLTSIARALRRLSSRHRESPPYSLVFCACFFGDPPREA